MKIETLHEIFLKSKGLVIDTRKTEPGVIFVALQGEKHNANTFAKEALEKGAAYTIIDDKFFYIDHRTILVENTLTSLQELAKFHRNYLKIPIIALTGSNGKTTTKELILAVLSKKYRAKATFGNLNNHIGVPLTLLSFTTETEIGIVEMGANHLKEIEFLCQIATPDFGHITNFGKAHLEGFGNIEGVIRAKCELYNYLLKNQKTAFINLQDPIQVENSKDIKSYTFGTNTNADLIIRSVFASPFVNIDTLGQTIQSQLIGIYNANNLNAAIAIGRYFEVPITDIKEALEGYIPKNNRSQLLIKGTNELILDTYNANPSSMKVALENFILIKKAFKVAILGDMFELGQESTSEHKKIVELLEKETNINCFFVGKNFYLNQTHKKHFCFFENFEDFSDKLKKDPIRGSFIFIKGSRGMALERTLDFLY